MIDFVPLHLHTNVGSPYDALGTPREWVSAALDLGIDCMAITEHGNMNSLAEFVLASQDANKAGKKFHPIFGVEFYFIKDVKEFVEAKHALENKNLTDAEIKALRSSLKRRYHLVVWAINEVGLKNLFRLVSESHKEPYFYYKPRIDFNLLKQYSEGLAGSSACIQGIIGGLYNHQTVTLGIDSEVAFQSVNKINQYLKSIFRGNWYNEIQWNNILEQHIQNDVVIKSALLNKIPIITTTDSHFIKQSDWKSREFYYQMKFMRGAEEEEKEYKIPDNMSELRMDLSLKNGDMVWASYKNYSNKANRQYDDGLVRESITNTRSVSEMIREFYPSQEPRMPNFIMEQYSKEPIEEIRDRCIERLNILNKNNDLYVSRLEHELELIDHRGFSKYFLTMKQIVSEAKEIMFTGAGRGSVGGSLVAYLLDITQVDPIVLDLSFSRFLTHDVIGYPDIDFDCANPLQLKETLINKWGEEKLVFVSNWNLLSFKTIVKDLAKFFGIPFQEVNEVTKIAINETFQALSEANPELQKTYVPTLEEILKHSVAAKDYFDKYPHLLEHIKILSGQVRDVSTHAGGVIIGDDLKDDMPLIQKNGKYQTPWPEGQAKRLLEPMGFIKFDILGIATLQMIERTLKKVLIKANKPSEFKDVMKFYDEKLHPDKLNFSDNRVYDNVFHKGHFVGVFQFSNSGMQELVKEFKPTSLTDLAVVTSIYRPGPLAAGVDKMYLESRRTGKEAENFGSDEYSKSTKETNGFIIFQEQISSIVSALGEGISEDDGQKVRKLLTKKKGGDLEKLKPYIDKLYAGCLSKGMRQDDIDSMWHDIVGYSAYCFNKSHAVSYSIISYQCAFLNTYCPREWVSSVLDVEFPLKKNEIVKEVKNSGYKVSPVKYGTSRDSWYIDDKDVVYPPYWVLKGISKDAAEKIMSEEINNIFDLYLLNKTQRKTFRINVIKVLIECGVFDHLFVNQKINKRGMVEFLTVNKKQIYSLQHFIEVLEFFCKDKREYSELEIGIALKDNTDIFYEKYFYPNDVVTDCLQNGIKTPAHIGYHVESGAYIMYIDEIVNFSGTYKISVIDEYGQYKNLFSKDKSVGSIKAGNLYFVELTRKNKTTYFNNVKNVAEFVE